MAPGLRGEGGLALAATADGVGTRGREGLSRLHAKPAIVATMPCLDNKMRSDKSLNRGWNSESLDGDDNAELLVDSEWLKRAEDLPDGEHHVSQEVLERYIKRLSSTA